MFSNIFECNVHTFARDHVFLDALFVFHAFVRVASCARRFDPGREDDKFMCARALEGHLFTISWLSMMIPRASVESSPVACPQ